MDGPFTSYAQNFEDVRLLRAFHDVAAGRYLDIGTQDPVRDSVSLAFYERGWRGVHVEPTPAYAAAMRAARPDETVIEAAVSRHPGPIPFFEIPETGISTGVANIAAAHARAGWQNREIAVATVTLAALFDLMGDAPIHWLKIDVEGMEADVLRSWGDHPARPIALVIEATVPNTQIPTHDEWYDLVLSRGYRDVLFDGLSRYFIHETQAERGSALALSPNVFDGFQVTPSHFVSGRMAGETEALLEQARQRAEAQREEAVLAANEQAKAALETARAELEQRILGLQSRLTETEEALAETQRQGLSLAREAGQLQGQLRAEAEAAAAQLRQAEETRLKLKTRLAAVDDRLTQTQARLQDERASGEALRARIALTESTNSKLNDDLAAANGALDEHRRKEAALSAQVAERTEQLAAANRALDESRRMKSNLAVQVAEITEQLAAANRARDEHRRTEAALSAQVTNCTAQLAAANRSVDEGQQRELALSAQVAEAAQRLAEGEAALRQAEALGVSRDTELAQAQARMAWLNERLRQAAGLLDHAPDPLDGWPRRLAMLLARIANRQPDAIAANRAASIEAWRATLSDPAAQQPLHGEFTIAENTDFVDGAAIQGSPFMSADESPITSVPRLLAPHDAEFIRVAYQAILGRAPDPEGGTYYLGRLRAGTHKLEILKQLRRSPEGRNFIPGVAGLDRAIRRHRIANLPLVGPIIRTFNRSDGNSAVERQLRVILNEVGRLHADQTSLFRAVSALADRPVVVACTAEPPSVNQPNGPAQDAPVQPRANLAALPTLAATLDEIGPMASFEHFLSSLQSSVARSREATMLNQS